MLPLASHLGCRQEHVVEVGWISVAGSRRNAAAAPLSSHHHQLPQLTSTQTQTSSSSSSVSSCTALFAFSAFPQELVQTKRLRHAKLNTKQSAPSWAGGGRCLFQSVTRCLSDSSFKTLVWQFAQLYLTHTRKLGHLWLHRGVFFVMSCEEFTYIQLHLFIFLIGPSFCLWVNTICHVKRPLLSLTVEGKHVIIAKKRAPLLYHHHCHPAGFPPTTKEFMSQNW